MYDCHNEKIEISFDSYYPEDSDCLVEKNCTLTICGWTKAKGKLSKDKHWSSDIEYFMGGYQIKVFSPTDIIIK